MLHLGVAVLAACLFLVLGPSELWAWGPSTHVALGSHVLASLYALPLPLRELLSAYPYEFLYGNLSADITLAKRYVHLSRHCHRWDVGFLLLERAERARLKSFALGYLSHLAADTVAHNVFVPRQLLMTSTTARVGHPYWEARFDAHLDSEHLRTAREVVWLEHTGPDELLENVLTKSIFSFRTNKRIYRRLIHLSNDERWQTLFEKVIAQSRWDLPEDQVEHYLNVIRHFVMDFLSRGAASRAFDLDPIGVDNLKLAKRVRRRTIRHSRQDSGRIIDLRKYPDDVAAVADILFPVPAVPSLAATSFEATGGAGEPAWEEADDFWERFTGELALVQ
jgi:hypothetical protein